MREARIEAAERSGVVVDLRDAEVARLELLNDALDPLFKEIPDGVELFDRGVSRGDVPRLWVDVIAHVEMGRDKRQYRFVQDTRYGRAVLAESYEVPEMVQAVTRYVARRLVERERALADDAALRARSSRRRSWLDAIARALARVPHVYLWRDPRRRRALAGAARPHRARPQGPSTGRHYHQYRGYLLPAPLT